MKPLANIPSLTSYKRNINLTTSNITGKTNWFGGDYNSLTEIATKKGYMNGDNGKTYFNAGETPISVPAAWQEDSMISKPYTNKVESHNALDDVIKIATECLIKAGNFFTKAGNLIPNIPPVVSAKVMNQRPSEHPMDIVFDNMKATIKSMNIYRADLEVVGSVLGHINKPYTQFIRSITGLYSSALLQYTEKLSAVKLSMEKFFKTKTYLEASDSIKGMLQKMFTNVIRQIAEQNNIYSLADTAEALEIITKTLNVHMANAQEDSSLFDKLKETLNSNDYETLESFKQSLSNEDNILYWNMKVYESFHAGLINFKNSPHYNERSKLEKNVVRKLLKKVADGYKLAVEETLQQIQPRRQIQSQRQTETFSGYFIPADTSFIPDNSK